MLELITRRCLKYNPQVLLPAGTLNQAFSAKKFDKNPCHWCNAGSIKRTFSENRLKNSVLCTLMSNNTEISLEKDYYLNTSQLRIGTSGEKDKGSSPEITFLRKFEAGNRTRDAK